MKTENTNKRVVFTMGGKGGVGKTGLMVALAEWFEAHEIPLRKTRLADRCSTSSMGLSPK
jgi:hypothetical protein